MDADQYLEHRLDDQIAWYDRKSQSNQTWYKRLRMSEIVAASSIPILSAQAFDGSEMWAVTIAILGALVAVIAAVSGLYQFEQNWIKYRTTCESLKKEKFLFLTRSDPYNDREQRRNFHLLVQRVETQLSKENTDWAQYIREPKGEATPQA